jgi:hypothetical protein
MAIVILVLLCISSLILPLPWAAEAVNSSLVGYWSFDEGSGTVAHDSSGNGNDGTLVNGPQWVTGRSGSALSFDGINDYLSITEHTDLDPHTSDWTISAWVNIAKLNSDTSIPQFVILTKRNLASDGSLTLMVSGVVSASQAKFAFMWDAPSNIAGAESSLMNVLGWHNVVGVRKGSDLFVYVDGVEYGPDNVKGLGSYITSTTDVNSVSPIHLCHHGAWNTYYSGTVDELKIYNYARTATDIMNDYNGVTPTPTISPTPTPTSTLTPTPTSSSPPNSALVGYWNFDEATGLTVNDRSGNGNTGTLVNGPKWVSGIKGTALSFDGTNDYISIKENTDLDPHTSDWTLSTWVNVGLIDPDTSKPQFVIITKRELASDGSLTLIVHGRTSESMAKFGFVWDAPSTIAGAESPLMNVLGWHNVVGVRRGTNLYVYVDGVEYGPNNVKGSFSNYLAPNTDINSNSPIQLCHHGAWNKYYSGTVDELKIYNYARTAQQISTDYNSITPSPTLPPILPWEDTDGYKDQNVGSFWSGGGNCYGMSSTALLYFTHYTLNNFYYPSYPLQSPPAHSTYDLILPPAMASDLQGNEVATVLNNASLGVMFHQVYDPLRRDIENRWSTLIVDEKQQLSFLIGNLTNKQPVVLFVGDTTGSHHAVVAYGIESVPDDPASYIISIYDPNGSPFAYLDSVTGFNCGDNYNRFVVAVPKIIDNSWFPLMNTWLWPRNWFSWIVTDYYLVVADKKATVTVNGMEDHFTSFIDSQTFVCGIPDSCGIEEGTMQVYAIPASYGPPSVDPGSSQSNIFISLVTNNSGTLTSYGYLLNAQATQGQLNYTVTPSNNGLLLSTSNNGLIANVTFFSSTGNDNTIFQGSNLSIEGQQIANFSFTDWSTLNSTNPVKLQVSSIGQPSQTKTLSITNSAPYSTGQSNQQGIFIPMEAIYPIAAVAVVAIVVLAIVFLKRTSNRNPSPPP